MAMLFEKSVVSPVFIGRASSLLFLERAFEERGIGSPRIVLVSGEAGIGKSRLVAEVKARLGSERVRFLQGACFEQDRTLPLAPFAGLLQNLLLGDERDEHLGALAPFASELVKFLPDLMLWLPEVAPAAPLGPEQEKRRLFMALSRFLLELCRQRPTIFILEDMHWSDEVSLEFLLFLSHQGDASSLHLVLTYRDTEVSASLRHLLVALNRERAAIECTLAPLSKEETHALVRAIFQMQRPVQRTFLDMLYTLTDGNPFFVEELLKALLTSGDIFFKDGLWDRKPLQALRVPRSIADAVQQRLDVLSEEAREMLDLAAVFGRQVEYSLFHTLMQHPPDDLLSLVEALVAAQLLVETAEGQLAFRHTLTRQAVYARLLSPRRRALHLHIARTLEGQGEQVIEHTLTDLTFHFYQAQAWPQALKYGHLAGEQALIHYIPQVAVEHFTRALEAASHLPGVSMIPLYLARGQAHHDLGSFAAALSDWQEALELAHTAGDRSQEWQSLMKLGGLWIDRDYTRTGDYFQRALTLAQEIADAPKKAYSQNYLAHWLTNIGQPVQAIPLHEEALASFQQRAEMPQVAMTLEYFVLALAYSGDLPRSISLNDQATALFRAGDQKRNLVNCLLIRCGTASLAFSETVWSARVSLERCQQDVEESLTLTRTLEWQPGQAGAHLTAGFVYTSYGLLSQGLAHAQRGLEIATEIESRQWIAASYYSVGAAHLALLNPRQAITVLEAGLGAARSRGAAFWIGMLVAALAQAHLLTGDLPQAEAVLAPAFSSEQIPSTVQERSMLLIWGQLALVQQQAELALHLADRLIATVPGETSTDPIPALWKLRGEALGALGRNEEALRVLEEAADEARIQGALPLLWQIQRSLGQVSLLARRRGAARQALAAARETIARLAASLDDEQQRASFSQAALATLPKQPQPTPRQVAREAFGGLSAREREVVLLIAQGKTNREIAAALNISHSTTSTHIGHIYNRLGLSTRAQLVAWAIKHAGV